MTQTIGLRIGGIVVQLDEGSKSGTISSDLHCLETSEIEKKFSDNEEWLRYESAVDAIEGLILSHAISGVDILSKEYREGVQTTVDAIGNNV